MDNLLIGNDPNFNPNINIYLEFCKNKEISEKLTKLILRDLKESKVILLKLIKKNRIDINFINKE